MFSRHVIAIAALTLASLISARPASTGPVATKLAEFKEEFYPAALAFSGDGSKLAVNFMVGDDGVQIWDWRKSHLIRKLVKVGAAGDGYALDYSPDGKFLAVRHGRTLDGRFIRVWNAETGELAHDLVVNDDHGDPHGMVFSPDGQLIVLTMERFNSDPRDQVLVFRTDTWELAWGLRTSPFQPDQVAFSPDQKFLALGGQVGAGLGTPPQPKILIVDTTTRQIVLTIDAPFEGAISPATLAWSPDGLRIAAGTSPGDNSPEPEVIKIFEAGTGKKIAGIPAKTATVTGLTYSADGRYLIAGSVDDSVRIMDGHKHTLLQTIPGDWRSVTVSRDSRYLAISASPKISVWELK